MYCVEKGGMRDYKEDPARVFGCRIISCVERGKWWSRERDITTAMRTPP